MEQWENIIFNVDFKLLCSLYLLTKYYSKIVFTSDI